MQLLILVSVLAQTNPIVLADYYKVETVSSPALSPDGKQVAYLKTRIIESENRRHNDLCIDSRCLTQIKASAASPQWSPDGKLLYYSAGGRTWFLNTSDLDGQPFEIPGLAGSPTFSPDHQWIAFTKRQDPAVPAIEQAEADRLMEQRFKGRVYDWMNFRFDGRGYLPNPQTHPALELYILPRQGGEARKLTSLNVNVEQLAWSPDSKSIAFVANTHQREERTYERADLFTINLDGKFTRLTDDNHNHSRPAWSPDGKSIVFLREESLNLILANKRTQGSPLDLYSVPAAGGPLTNLTANWDDLPGAPVFSRDGKSIFFEANLRGTGHLYQLELSSKRVTQVTQGDRLLDAFDIHLDSGRIVYTATNPDTPAEILSATLANPKAETRITTQPARWKLGRTERLSFDSLDGTPIEGWVTLPPNYDPNAGPYPLILNIHGGPHGAYASSFSFLHQLQAAAGYIVLYTNPRASTGYGEKFRWATWGGWGDKDMADVMSGVNAAIKKYRVDPKRLGVTGYSYGGFLTNWIIGHTNTFKAAITGAGPTNWISNYGTGDIPRTKETEFLGPPWEPVGNATMIKYSPITYVKNMKTPTLFVHGEADLRVPIAQAEELYTALKKLGVPARFARYPGEYHGGWSPWNTMHRYNEEMRWWAQYLQ
ncbi:MAG: S9 family peptidase [Acidobacteria bacterium]|nr:S9 family peptidase [Acidobacteriota bacterium]